MKAIEDNKIEDTTDEGPKDCEGNDKGKQTKNAEGADDDDDKPPKKSKKIPSAKSATEVAIDQLKKRRES